jgi:hypothetical protein
MRGPVRRIGDSVARRIAFETNRWRLDEPAEEPLEPSTREQYLAIAMLRDRIPDPNGGLSANELRVFSQNGEDGVLAEIFARIGVGPRYFVEFGVQDGVQCNTRFLAEVLGWSGLYIEADAEFFAGLYERLVNRPDLATVQAMVTPENVQQLFRDANVPEELDLLSIDVDGQDYWIWQAIDQYRPRVVVIEYNSGIRATEQLVEPRGRAASWSALIDFYGASEGALRALGEHKGYALVHADLAGVNLFFVRKDLATTFTAPALSRGPNFELLGHRHRPYEGDEVYERVSPGHDPNESTNRGE